MSYYDTIDDDVRRAKEILARGRVREEDLILPIPPGLTDDPAERQQLVDRMAATLNVAGGTIYGADIYAAYKLLESFVAEIERLRTMTQHAEHLIRENLAVIEELRLRVRVDEQTLTHQLATIDGLRADRQVMVEQVLHAQRRAEDAEREIERLRGLHRRD